MLAFFVEIRPIMHRIDSLAFVAVASCSSDVQLILFSDCLNKAFVVYGDRLRLEYCRIRFELDIRFGCVAKDLREWWKLQWYHLFDLLR